jgi:hypothetical protein
MESLAIKVAGEWALDVLVPFGSPARKDSHGEWFDMQTDFAADYYPLPPAVYHHGYAENKRPDRKPEYLGKTVSRTVKASEGIWHRVELEPSKPRAAKIMRAAREGKAAASPGSIEHLIRRAPNGHLEHWPIVELSIFDTYDGQRPANPYAVAIPAVKAIYDEAGLALPDDIDRAPDHGAEGSDEQRATPDSGHPDQSLKTMEGHTMDVNQETIQAAVKAALDAERAALAAAKKQEEDIAAEVEKRTAAIKAELEQKAAEGRRLQFGGGENGQGQAPVAAKFGDLRRYDNLDLGDTAVMVGVLDAAARSGRGKAPSEAAMKALVMKASEDTSWVGERTRQALKAAGIVSDPTSIKANEINQAGLTSYGAEWVSDAWSNTIWEKIRIGTPIVAKIPTVEIPQGADSLTIPLESTSPTFYKVAAAADLNATTGRPDATVPSTRLGTTNKTITANKMGARIVWNGELDEDSIIPWASELRMSIEKEGAEVLESVVIDGDTETAATTNINHIGGTPSATDYYLLFNGFRKLALVTNTANSRDGGVLALGDFLETVKLMGAAGINALDRSKVAFIVDPLVYYKTLELTQVLTRDLFASPTIEGGQLTGLFGYAMDVSANICRMSTTRLSNAAGKVDQTTPANNTKGSILSVRYDQWRLGFKRRMTLEVTRYPEADANQIVCLTRVGLINRDTEASAVSYNITV